MRYLFISVFLGLFVACQPDLPPTSALVSEGESVPVFVSGEEGYACFRIPAVISTSKGELIAFAEGRKNGCSDTGNIDLVMKRSADGGKSWSPIQLIWDDGENVCGNPAPVLDETTGVIHLLSTWNLGSDKESEIIAQTSEDTRHVYVLSSSDGGETWSEAREITATTKLPNWTWYATGPGSGIQASVGRHGGSHDGGTLVERMMVACDHIEAESKHYYSHVIYSDDHGQSWQLGGSTPNHQVNECEVVQLSDGNLMLNMRNYDRNVRRRQTAISKDGGLTWTDQKHDSTLIEPICQASLQSYAHGEKELLLFSNPASEEKRIRMTVRASEDQGQSWKHSLLLHEGPSAYSDLVVMKDGLIGCLFEMGVESPYETISFGRVRIHE